jgi:hypothetical protein
MKPSMRNDGGGRRTNEEIIAYALQQRGVHLVGGFEELLDGSVCQQTGDIVAAFTEVHKAYRVDQMGSDRLVWKTEPVPQAIAGDVVFLFDVAMGNGSPLPQPSGRFDLLINGDKALSFCVSKSARLWQEANGTRFYYDVKRLRAAQPGFSVTLDSQIKDEGMASFGLGLLHVPTQLLKPGEPLRLEVVPVNRNPSTRWCRVGRLFDALGLVDFWPGLDAVMSQRSYPRLGEYHVFFGDIHSHSAESTIIGPDRGCGTGSRVENFHYARDVAGLDFFALSEHDWQMADEDWQALRETNEIFYEPGRFVTLHCFEWTSLQYGHRNVYFLEGEQPFFKSWPDPKKQIDPSNPNPQDLWDALDQLGTRAITIPHHTSSCSFPLSLHDYFNPKYDRLVEIYSSWGSAEYAGNPTYEYDDKYPELHTVNFLDDGFRFGFCASSDGHDGCPGNAQSPHHKPRYRVCYHSLGSGRVAVLARELTREAVFDALYHRRCYATTGEPTVLGFSLDQYQMGSELHASQVSGQPRFQISVDAHTEIDRIDVLKNGRVVAHTHGMGSRDTWEWRDPDLDPARSNYFYARVTMVDGEMAWSSPIWISPGTN